MIIKPSGELPRQFSSKFIKRNSAHAINKLKRKYNLEK